MNKVEASELSGVDLVAGLSDEAVEAFAAELKRERHPVGYVLAEQGDISSKFFILLDGHVTVHRDGAHVADLGPGDIMGEMGVIAQKSRNASVIATTPIEVAVAMGWSLRECMDAQPDLKARLEAVVAARSSD